MVPNTIFWLEEADNMHGVHKGRPTLDIDVEAAEVEGLRYFVSVFYKEFPPQSSHMGMTDGFW